MADNTDKTKLIMLIVAPIVAVLILAAYVFFLVMPKFKEIKKVNKEIEDVGTKIAELKKLKAEKEKHRREYKELSKKKQEYEMKLPAEDDEVVELFNNLSDLAKNKDIKIKFVESPKPKPEEKIYTEFSRRITMECKYDQLGEFINYIEFMDMFVKVTDIQVSPTKNPYILNVSLVCSTFVSNEKEKL
jgi:Tfp pilus assembly protein PilO